MRKTVSRKYVSIILVLIIITLGILRELITENIGLFIHQNLNVESQQILRDFLLQYGSTKSISQWIANYVVYYPIYLACHFTLINHLFREYPVAKKWINRILVALLILLIAGKLIFGILNVPVMEEYFSFAFHKLIALPFLLLAIEGGSYFYKRIFFEGDIE